MDLHAVWNRIDQLERLVMSQAKEINQLKHVVNSTCLPTLPSESRQQFLPKSNTLDNHQKLVSTKNELHNTNQNRNASGRNSVALTFHPYSMSPVVHPTTAIPPINSQPVVIDIEDRQTNSNYNKLARSNLNGLSYGRSSVMVANGSKYSPHAHNEIDQDSGEESSSDQTRHERQSFVESAPTNSDLPLTPPPSQLKDDTSLGLNCSNSSTIEENLKSESIDLSEKEKTTPITTELPITCPILASSQGLASSSDDLMSYTVGEIVTPTDTPTQDTGPMPVYINVDASKKFRTIPLVHKLQAKKLKIDWPTLN